MGGKRRGGLLLERRNLLAEIAKARPHRRIGERLHGGAGEPRDDVQCGPLRRPEAKPGRDVHARRAGFVHRRNIRRGGKPPLAGDRVGAHLPLRTDGSALIAWSNEISMWPAVRSRITSAEPARYGTNTKLVPVTF